MLPTRVGGLFMDMGTGKSLTAIILAHHRREKISKVVWCCPVSLKRNTADQIRRHTDCADSDVFVFNDTVDDASLPVKSWYIVGLESVGGSNRVAMAVRALIDDRTMLIVDESSYIKGPLAKRTRRLIAFGAVAKYRLIMTGTPITQGIEDLYAQITFLSDKILGYKSWRTFQRAHIVYSDRFPGQISRRVNIDKLTAKLEPYVYQVTKEECLSLPDRSESHLDVKLTRKQDLYYELAKERFLSDAADQEYDFSGIAVYRLFSALRAIANGVVPAGFDRHGESLDNNKTSELVECLATMPETHVIVWVGYRRSVVDVSRALATAFPGRNVSAYYGDLSESDRDQELAAWRQRGGYLVATASCGGYGLTLTEAAYCVFYTCSFKFSEHRQAQDRIHRIGQARNVHYVYLWARCGIENRVAAALDSKGDALESLRQAIEKIKGSKADALKELVAEL